MSQRCIIALFMFIFAAFAGLLGLNALSQVESMDVPEIFAYIPLGIAFLAFLVAICILAGIYTPKRRAMYVTTVYR
ncbi:MAG: hypothetical protein JW779_15970 [Candidatus Thorarchaeota archaeon]|nr:hypothetical protein [Candidatus Thorarchaeota archaeon]